MPIQSVLIPCGSRMTVDVEGITSADVKIGDSVFTVDGGSERSVGPFASDVTCSIDYTGYPSIYLTDDAGAITTISLPLPDPESLPVGAVVNIGDNVVESADGIWQGKRRTVFVKTGSETDSAFNTLQIQTALNLGGIVEIVGEPGKVYVDKSVNTVACLVHPSFTTLVVPDNIRITQAAGQKVPLIVSKSVADYMNGLAKIVTLSWVSGNSFTVTSVAHGKAVGDYVSIYKTSVLNTDPIQFAGTFMIRSVIDANSFTCYLHRSGVVAPTNTTQWVMLGSTVSAKLHGGQWDYNVNADNVPVGQTIASMCMIYAFTAINEINPNTFFNTKKYCIMSGCDYGSYIARCNGDASTGSDGVKVYGPAVSTRVGRITGSFHDDCFSSQSYEAEAYAGYRVCWGDVLSVHVEEISATSTTAGAVVYVNNQGLGRVDGVTFGKITSNTKVALVGLESKSGDVGYVDFGVVSRLPLGVLGAFQFQTANVKAAHIKANILIDPLSMKDIANINSTTHIDKLELSISGGSTTEYPAGTYTLIPLSGEVDKLILRGSVKGAQGNMRILDLPATTSGYVKHVEIDMCVESAAWVCRFNVGTQTYIPVVDIKGDYSRMDSVFNSNNTSNVARVRVGDVNVDSVPGGVVRAAAGVTVMSGSSGIPYLTGGSALNVPNGGTISAWS